MFQVITFRNGLPHRVHRASTAHVALRMAASLRRKGAYVEVKRAAARV